MRKHTHGGKVREYAWVAVIGGAGYSFLEILWRGHTHWSMALAGGVCLPLIYRIHAGRRHNLAVRSVICAGLITLLLGWQVWDYSGLRFNLMGQVCLLYSLLWCLLSAAICPVCTALRKHFDRLDP
jgi:hypothetical protein